MSYQLNQPFAALVKYRNFLFGTPKAKGIELSELENLLEEIIQAQKNTAQKEAFTRIYQNVSKHSAYTYEY